MPADGGIAVNEPDQVKTFGSAELAALSEQARASARLRKNYNVHARLDDPVQRLFNAFEPGTYVRPHRHPQAGRWELFTVIRGAVGILLFDDQGRVSRRVVLSDRGPDFMIEIPDNTWHTVFSLQSGTVLFEVKQGPYEALSDKDFAAWSPGEGEAQAAGMLEWFTRAAVGERAPRLAAGG